MRYFRFSFAASHLVAKAEATPMSDFLGQGPQRLIAICQMRHNHTRERTSKGQEYCLDRLVTAGPEIVSR